MTNDELINLIKKQIEEHKITNETKKEMQPPQPAVPTPIVPKNIRTVPCRNYHGPQGCTRGDYCHFIHAFGYECKYIN